MGDEISAAAWMGQKYFKLSLGAIGIAFEIVWFQSVAN